MRRKSLKRVITVLTELRAAGKLTPEQHQDAMSRLKKLNRALNNHDHAAITSTINELAAVFLRKR